MRVLVRQSLGAWGSPARGERVPVNRGIANRIVLKRIRKWNILTIHFRVLVIFPAKIYFPFVLVN